MPRGAPAGNTYARKRAVDPTAGPWSRWRSRSRAARCVRFIEAYCMLPKGHGAGSLMSVARFQREAIEAAYEDGVRAFGMMVPKGNGKSTLLAGMALHALFDPPEDVGQPQIPIVAVALHQ